MRHVARQNSRSWTTAASLLLAAATAVPACAQLSLQQALLLRANGVSVALPADAAPPAAPATTEDALHALADAAAVIFAGEVLRVQQSGDSVQIDLRVDDGIRGVTTGDTYTLREWAGLWPTQADRLRVGQRAMYLLHAPSVGGFSSPVGGVDGIIPLSGDEITAATDLRWVAARVQRSAAARPDNAPDGTAARANTVYAAGITPVLATPEHSASAASNGMAWPADATNGNVLGTDLRAIDAGLVSGLLRAWKSSAPAETR